MKATKSGAPGPRQARKPAPRPRATADRISVRMYNVGFGDCFLITFPAPDRPRKVLVDCGFHQAGPPPRPIREVVDAVIADATEQGGPRIDVVVCSHRHRDHVFGFEAADAWKAVHVDEVWMPWTEDPHDPRATRIRETQARKAQRLALAIPKLAGLDADLRQSILEIALNNDLTNSKAMHTLHHGFSGEPKPHFLPEQKDDKDLRRLESAALPGVRVHVLGPSRHPDVIRDMNPPPDESFLRGSVSSRAGGASASPAPFLLRWAVSPSGAAFDRWLADTVKHGQGLDDGRRRPGDADFLASWVRSLGLRGRDLKAVDEAADDDPLAAAVALDKAVNGTSLMLSFERGEAVLLFPGDAQWGTWKRALEDPEWRELLGRTTFYKVGHHGSHNATPVEFVKDVLGARFQAMVSTRATKFDDIPRRPLLEELALRSKLGIVRSDAATVDRPFQRVSPLCIEATVSS